MFPFPVYASVSSSDVIIFCRRLGGRSQWNGAPPPHREIGFGFVFVSCVRGEGEGEAVRDVECVARANSRAEFRGGVGVGGGVPGRCWVGAGPVR